ncbi:MAG: ATP-binding cassette domain-containing protein [Planctomycetes bacterium]|nr:ATP-binding cassette domain-containing protein [Planctomycetota bacterium]
MVKVEDLTKRYGQIVGIDGVSFEVEKGEVVGLLGPNGAGKSTTMRILTCFMPATSGDAQVAGHDVFSQSLEVKKHVGYLPENVPLYPEMRVSEYLDYRGVLKGLRRPERRKRTAEALERTRTKEVAGRIVGQLSKGYRQRVGLADALLHDPDVLILDEPTVGLDPNQIRETRALIKELGESHTVILSTHILPEVEMVCSRVLIMNAGKLVPQEVIDRYLKRSGFRLVLTGDWPGIQKKLTAIEGVSRTQLLDKTPELTVSVETRQGTDLREKIFDAVVGGGGKVLEMRQAALSLEEAFTRITTADTAAADEEAA